MCSAQTVLEKNVLPPFHNVPLPFHCATPPPFEFFWGEIHSSVYFNAKFEICCSKY